VEVGEGEYEIVEEGRDEVDSVGEMKGAGEVVTTDPSWIQTPSLAAQQFSFR
jgi:hypothetical protein